MKKHLWWLLYIYIYIYSSLFHNWNFTYLLWRWILKKTRYFKAGNCKVGGELCENKSSRAISSSTDLYYPDHASSSNPNVHSHMMNHIQSFDSNSEMFNSSTGLEMIRLSKNLEQQSHDGWKCYFGKKPSQPCPSKLMNESTNDFYFTKHDFNAGTSGTSREINNTQVPWQESRFHVDESNSIFRGVFPSEGNQRPISQGLSLSLSSNNPSNIGLQSFESRHANYNHHGQHDDNSIRFDIPTTSRDRFHGQSTSTQRQQQFMQDGLLGESSSFYQHGQFQMRLSKYLSATQELLNEFCSLGTKQDCPLKKKFNKSELIVDDEHGIGSSSLRRQQPLHSFDFMDLQKRKTKLLLMLEEVDKRYRHDRDQMKAVVSPFEAIAGLGSASVYTALASKAMSRHFKCLRDAIVEQIQGIKKAMGDKDQAVPGSSRGETPRLRILDQSFRQQKAMQQMTVMDSSPWRPQRGLPERSVSILRAWLFEHFLNPYPTDVDKHILARQTGLSRSQVSNWFINARVRLWKPMVEEMYLEELKEQENTSSSGRAPEDSRAGQNPPDQEEKPTQEQLIQLDSQSLPSIVQPKDDDRHHNTSVHGHHNNIMPQQNQCFGRVGETLGVMDLDFASYNASYNHNPGGSVSYKHESVFNHSINSGGGVSLTLGLQQHGESAGMSLAFSPAQSSLFYTRENIEDCQPVHYSLIDGEEQNQPYRNLMGAQILHDFAE